MDEQNLFIRIFWYDGTGPDAFFWVGTTPMPTPKGWVVPYPPVNMESSNMGKINFIICISHPSILTSQSHKWAKNGKNSAIVLSKS